MHKMSSWNGSNFDENENEAEFGDALLNEQILPKILKHLPFDSLLASRQVCKTWNSVICSHPQFAKRCVVTVRHSVDTALSLFLGPAAQEATNHNRKQLATLSSFRFITKFMNNSTPTQLEFWESFGKLIQYLDLGQHSLGAVSFLEVLLACPNLKELNFDCTPICASNAAAVSLGLQSQEYQKLIPNSQFVEKSGLFQSLEALRISNSNYMPPGVLADLLQWSCRARGRGLRCLSVSDDQLIPSTKNSTDKPPIPSWDVRHVLYLVEMQAKNLVQLELSGFHILAEHVYALAKMKHLNLRILKLRGVQVDTPSLISLFRRQKYLEELDLSYTYGVSEKAFLHTSCTFYKLRKLSLAGYTSHLDFLSFLSRMVNLVELNLSCSRSHSMTWDNLIHSFLPIKLRKLSRLDLSYCYALGSLKKQSLFQSFIRSLRSTLTCLNLSCNTCVKNNYLQILWHELPKLRILYLETLPGVTNEGFTGIRQSQFYGNEDANAAGKQNGIIDYLNSSGVLRKHNNGAGQIGYCANIETLSLANNPKLTDFVVQYGVRFLSNLKQLKLSGCPRITDRSVFFLVGSCGKLEYLDLRGCPRVTHEWIGWAEAVSVSSPLKILLDPRPGAPAHDRGVTKPRNVKADTILEIDEDFGVEQDEDTDTDATSAVKIIMPRKYRLKAQGEGQGHASSSRNVVILTPGASSREEDEDGPFKIKISDANNNKLKIPV